MRRKTIQLIGLWNTSIEDLVKYGRVILDGGKHRRRERTVTGPRSRGYAEESVRYRATLEELDSNCPPQDPCIIVAPKGIMGSVQRITRILQSPDIAMNAYRDLVAKAEQTRVYRVVRITRENDSAVIYKSSTNKTGAAA